MFSFERLFFCIYAMQDKILWSLKTRNILQKKQYRYQFHFCYQLPYVRKNLADSNVMNLINNWHLTTANKKTSFMC